MKIIIPFFVLYGNVVILKPTIIEIIHDPTIKLKPSTSIGISLVTTNMAHLGCNANNASLSSVQYHHDLWQTGKEKKHQTTTPGMKEHVFYVVWIAFWTIGAFCAW